MERLAYRITEAAQVIGVSRTKMYALIKARQIPVISIGKSVRVPAVGLQDWVTRQMRLSRRTVAGASQPASGATLCDTTLPVSVMFDLRTM